MNVTFINSEGVPEFTEEIAVHPFVLSVKKESINLYNNFATYIHYMYRKDSLYFNLAEEERKEKIDEEIFKEAVSRKILNSLSCVSFINRVKQSMFSDAERFYEGAKQDLEIIKNNLISIPLQKKGFYEQEVPSADGESTVKIKVEVMIDNSAEKLKACDMAEKLFAFIDKLEVRMKKEEKKKSSKVGRRLFDE